MPTGDKADVHNATEITVFVRWGKKPYPIPPGVDTTSHIIMYGGIHGRFKKALEEVLSDYPYVKRVSVGWDPLFPSASFSAFVIDAASFNADLDEILGRVSAQLGINIKKG